MRLLLVFYCLVFFNCTQKRSTQFLQPNQVSLAQPRVVANSTLIDSFVTIKANLKLDDVSIYYTSNGEEPSRSTTKYEHPIKVSNPGTFKFKAYHTDWNPSEFTALTLYKKGLDADTIVWHSKSSEKYKGQGENTLINQTKASLNFSDPQWVGFDTIASATVSFKDNTFVKLLTVSYLNDAGSWIFPPESITVILNEDISTKKTETIKSLNSLTARKMETVKIPIEAEVKSLRVEVHNLQSIPEWHEGHGTKAWLFMDEWILN
ncbi:chitobiase/beta-hexosaminidase C-terminal domain-containing protein [Snuella sedimenti]|uniref:Chitobiase/beta-hexosaminidase C-terminal domain-containing protein n=1 Tax=Snuella sedimenti TaxID=2798802 RepID=A0A8J7LXV7_9FLAO|nr:chitobiase/beta-hexosaminidase C-terminal domain-containing protein [Snuella sedimenti]MBJ6367421.1 chitobiase/beta-hexosaminidase C-terminal domain-containing protein [Snuella sedimenti]